MALPPLATVQDLSDWLDQPIDPANSRAVAVLSAASSLVRSYTQQDWVDEAGALVEVPDDVVTVVLQVAERKWRNPSGAIHETTGPFSVRYSERSGDGLFLTDTERRMLARYKRDALWSMSTTRGEVETGSVRWPYNPPWEPL